MNSRRDSRSFIIAAEAKARVERFIHSRRADHRRYLSCGRVIPSSKSSTVFIVDVRAWLEACSECLVDRETSR